MNRNSDGSRSAPGDERTPEKPIGEVKYAGLKQGGPSAQRAGEGVAPVNMKRSRFAAALGEAVLECWGQLSQDTQHLLFEKAVVCGHHDERDESLREQLAEYLHDHHPKTDH